MLLLDKFISMKSELSVLIDLAIEKGIAYSELSEAIQTAVITAYKKKCPEQVETENVNVLIDEQPLFYRL